MSLPRPFIERAFVPEDVWSSCSPNTGKCLMSQLLRLAHARRAGILLASGLAFAAVPAVASASAVNLGTASPFVVLAGSTATNTGPSVLNGDLGVYPGTSLTGFDTAVVNGATHDDDAVAGQAQSDANTAYNVAA